MPDKPIKYAAQLSHVKEISLLGRAGLPFWNERLKTQDLVAADKDGHAQVMIISADARFHGIRFRELSFSILVSLNHRGTEENGAFLLKAFNSVRLFAFCERRLFSTPYAHGDIRLSCSLPASFELTEIGQNVLLAQMHNDSESTRQPSYNGPGGWEGSVFLPRTAKHQKRFIAKLNGLTQIYPFLPSKDSVLLRPSARSEVLQDLVDSSFAPETWSLRQNADHAKSKTYDRDR